LVKKWRLYDFIWREKLMRFLENVEEQREFERGKSEKIQG